MIFLSLCNSFWTFNTLFGHMSLFLYLTVVSKNSSNFQMEHECGSICYFAPLSSPNSTLNHLKNETAKNKALLMSCVRANTALQQLVILEFPSFQSTCELCQIILVHRVELYGSLLANYLPISPRVPLLLQSAWSLKQMAQDIQVIIAFHSK